MIGSALDSKAFSVLSASLVFAFLFVALVAI